MARTLSTRDPGFEAAFRALLAAKRESAADVDDAVAAIIDAVAARGDAALVEYTTRFDRVRLPPERLRLSPDEIAAGAARELPPQATAGEHRLCRCGRRAARPTLAPDRCRRALCPGRYGILPLLGADERDPGQ